MKIIPTSYIFDASLKTITCDDFTAIEKLALITNLTTGDIIYQFNNVLKNGVITGNMLTLAYDTTSMSDTDDIQIIMEKDINPATEETLQSINQKKIGDSFWLKNVLSAITRLTVDASGQLRAIVSGTVAVGTITTLTTLTTGNIGIGDSGKLATMISQSNANFQGGGRRLIRKV